MMYQACWGGGAILSPKYSHLMQGVNRWAHFMFFVITYTKYAHNLKDTT